MTISTYVKKKETYDYNNKETAGENGIPATSCSTTDNNDDCYIDLQEDFNNYANNFDSIDIGKDKDPKTSSLDIGKKSLNNLPSSTQP
jgi:hypothetical protein